MSPLPQWGPLPMLQPQLILEDLCFVDDLCDFKIHNSRVHGWFVWCGRVCVNVFDVDDMCLWIYLIWIVCECMLCGWIYIILNNIYIYIYNWWI
jgi:hypothetical protein